MHPAIRMASGLFMATHRTSQLTHFFGLVEEASHIQHELTKATMTLYTQNRSFVRSHDVHVEHNTAADATSWHLMRVYVCGFQEMAGCSVQNGSSARHFLSSFPASVDSYRFRNHTISNMKHKPNCVTLSQYQDKINIKQIAIALEVISTNCMGKTQDVWESEEAERFIFISHSTCPSSVVLINSF